MSPLALSLRFLQTQPDARLIELARAGHERAFEALVQRHRRALLGYCRRINPADASAEDLLQQALLQAWIAITSHQTDVRDARAWLYRIVHNVAISTLRRANLDSVSIEPGQGENGADHELERRIAVRETLTGLASLPEQQRAALLSVAWEGRSHEEIAESMGLSHGAVRGLIYRARATLRAAAAVIVPAPLVNWAARQPVGPRTGSAALLEAVGGGGSAGLGAVLLKGGAIVVTAGALAGAAAVSTNHAARGHRPPAVGTASADRSLSLSRAAASRSAPGVRSRPAGAPVYAVADAGTGSSRRIHSPAAGTATFTFSANPSRGQTRGGTRSRHGGGGGSGGRDGSGGGEGAGGPAQTGSSSGSDGGSPRPQGGGSGGDHGGGADGRSSGGSSGSSTATGASSGTGSQESGSAANGGSDGTSLSDAANQSSGGGDGGHGGSGGGGDNGGSSTPAPSEISPAAGSGD